MGLRESGKLGYASLGKICVRKNIRRLGKDDLPHLGQFWVEHWSGEEIVTHGQVVRHKEVEAFVYSDWLALVTFVIRGNECEIISLNSLQEGIGIGTALLEEVILEAQKKHCRRAFLVTTNDNLDAIGFYQRRGWSLKTLRRNAMEEARKLKPTIPFIGKHNIPLRDEIELEMILPGPS